MIAPGDGGSGPLWTCAELTLALEALPTGHYRATRYDTDDLHVLHLWNETGESFDLTVPRRRNWSSDPENEDVPPPELVAYFDARRNAIMNVTSYRASPPEYPGLALVPVADLDRLATFLDLPRTRDGFASAASAPVDLLHDRLGGDGDDHDPRPAGESTERGLAKAVLDGANDAGQPVLGRTEVGGGHLDDHLDVGSEGGEGRSGHASNVQHTVDNVQPADDCTCRTYPHAAYCSEAEGADDDQPR